MTYVPLNRATDCRLNRQSRPLRSLLAGFLFGGCIDGFGYRFQPFDGDRLATDVGKAIGSISNFRQSTFYSHQAFNAAIYQQPLLLEGVEVLGIILVLARF